MKTEFKNLVVGDYFLSPEGSTWVVSAVPPVSLHGEARILHDDSAFRKGDYAAFRLNERVEKVTLSEVLYLVERGGMTHTENPQTRPLLKVQFAGEQVLSVELVP